VIHRVGAVSYALPPFLDLLGRVNRSPSRFKWNFVRLWKSMKPRVYENPHEGGTRDPRRDHVRIPKEIVLIPEPPFTFAAHSAPLLLWESQQLQRPSIEMRGEIGSGCSRKRKDRQRIGSADPSMLPPVPGTESLLEIWLGRSNRSRAGLAGSWTTRVQARRVPADPTADRKPKACHESTQSRAAVGWCGGPWCRNSCHLTAAADLRLPTLGPIPDREPAGSS